VVRVPGIAGGQQQPPGPLKARDGRARLVVSTVVSTVRRQLEPVTKLSPSCRDSFPPVRYVFAATMSAQRPTEVCSSAASPVSAGTSTTPARFQVQRADHVPDLGARPPDRLVVLKVTPAEPGITDQPVPALLDPLAGQLQVRPVPGLPVQLHHCRSTIGWPSSPPSWPRNVFTR
jgi:hypothetical protein